MEKVLKLCLTGFGNVGRKFCHLLLDKERYLAEAYGCRIVVTGISGRSKGSLVAPDGIDLSDTLRQVEEKGVIAPDTPGYFTGTPQEMMAAAQADVFIEMSTLSIWDGQPAASYIREAFSRKMYVITTNKGPEAWYYKELKDLAEQAGVQFLYEAIVMGGTPVFNLVEKTLHGNEISEISGILNCASNYVLKLLEEGQTYEAAIRAAQEIGLAEADPSMDMDGWDGAAKICALANIIMDAGITPKDVHVESASAVTAEDIERARAEGGCIKYICRAKRDTHTGQVEVSVKPEKIPVTHAYCTVNGTSSVITLYTDLAGELTLIQTDPGLLQTAYGVYSDLIALLKHLG